ncbi:trypsin-7-like [Aphidius gifuensis]|uniref:trypsin-7-like n=1 Tax=Aphidius gifuensis TaxID=684658 RepID=UPI001CDD39BA|nr:trypsin-7-like [Aphidius gifuensis]
MKLVSGFRTPSMDKAPYQVSVRYLGNHICGGNIITKYHVLTTASCIADYPNVYYANLKVLSGTTDQKNAHQQGTIHDVFYIIIHEEYNPQNSWIHDLAILRITVPFDYSNIRLPVQMESTSAAADPTIVRTSGWGQITLKSPVQSTRYMQTLNLKICALLEFLKYWKDYHISTYYQNCASMVFPDAAVGKGDGGNGLIDGTGKLVAG